MRTYRSFNDKERRPPGQKFVDNDIALVQSRAALSNKSMKSEQSMPTQLSKSWMVTRLNVPSSPMLETLPWDMTFPFI